MDRAIRRRPSAHDELTGVEPIFLVRTAPYLEPAAAGIEAEKNFVATGCEVGLELESGRIAHVVANPPEIERVATVERRVICIEATLETVDVNERFPAARDRTHHSVMDHEAVGPP